MALTILVTPAPGDIIQSSVWTNEFNNIYNNPISLISPLTGTVNLNSQTLSGAATFSGAITFSSTISVTGAATFNGDVTLGNATADTITITGILASGIEFGHASDTTLTRASAGVVAIEGNNVLVNGGALGTPSSGTLTNATGLPIAGLTASTSTALGVGSIELGHATDTTIARSGAGQVTIEGALVLKTAGMKKFDLVSKATETQVVNNSSVLVNDDTLLAALAANETVNFLFFIWHNSNTTADFKWTITSPAGSTIRFGQANTLMFESGGTVSQDALATASAGATTALQGNGTGFGIIVSGYAANGATPGNLQLQWSQNTATVVNTYVMTGSYLLVFRV